MQHEFPDSDTLLELAKNDPEELERIRQEACAKVIREAPERLERRLRGLQFQIDMERRRSKTPLEACIRISDMMHDAVWDLRCALIDAKVHNTAFDQLEKDLIQADVIPFKRTV